jgi:hypothetical protein
VSDTIAIVGSRGFQPLALVEAFVQALPGDAVVLSGGAFGVDTCAETTAQKRGLSTRVIRPNYAAFRGREHVAPLVRNREIVRQSDRVVAFWDGKSTGTAHVIEQARKLDKPLTVVLPGGAPEPALARSERLDLDA